MCKHQLASLGSNQEEFEESNPQGLQGPACMKICRIKIQLPLLLLNQLTAPQLCCHVITSAQLPLLNHLNQSLLNSLLPIHYPFTTQLQPSSTVMFCSLKVSPTSTMSSLRTVKVYYENLSQTESIFCSLPRLNTVKICL